MKAKNSKDDATKAAFLKRVAALWPVARGTPRLTIGESGLAVDKAYSFYVQLDVSLAVEQTWSMGNARLYFTRPATLV